MNILRNDCGDYLEIFYNDLNEEAKKTFDEIFKDHNYDTFPIVILPIYDEDKK